MTPEQEEMRTERRAICSADRIPEAEILAIFKARPDMFGVAEYEEHQDGMFAETTKQAL